MKKWTTPDSRNTPSTTNLEEEEIANVSGNDGNASMPEQVKRPNPWMMMMMMMMMMKYIKSVIWRGAKRLSFIEEARCLKVKINKLKICVSFTHSLSIEANGRMSDRNFMAVLNY